MRRLIATDRHGRPRSANRILVEECPGVLNSTWLSKSCGEQVSPECHSVTVTTTWPEGGRRFYSVIRLTRTILPTGGHRVWYLCPSCNRRCGRLYLVKETDRTYLCRLCLNAAYHIQYRKG